MGEAIVQSFVRRMWELRAAYVTSPIRTLLDIATGLTPRQLERAVNEADKRDLIDPDALLAALGSRNGEPGVRPLRDLLTRHAFVLTDSELEALFLPIARRAGLPTPVTQCRIGRGRVDFFFPSLGLVVETDGLRYHRTPAQQAKDRRRDQQHLVSGLVPLRFTHAQVKFEPRCVERTVVSVARRIASRR
ncbi:MAG: endonuclease domain-containing protein [Solirubrobacterales bacterium]